MLEGNESRASSNGIWCCSALLFMYIKWMCIYILYIRMFRISDQSWAGYSRTEQPSHLGMMTGAGFHPEGRHLQPLLQELKAVGATRGQGYEVRWHIFKPKQLRLAMLCYVMSITALLWYYPACWKDPFPMCGRSGPAIYVPSRHQRNHGRANAPLLPPVQEGQLWQHSPQHRNGGHNTKVKTDKEIKADHLSSNQLARMSPDHILPKRGLSRFNLSRQVQPNIIWVKCVTYMWFLQLSAPWLHDKQTARTEPCLELCREFRQTTVKDTIPQNRSENLHLWGTPWLCP